MGELRLEVIYIYIYSQGRVHFISVYVTSYCIGVLFLARNAHVVQSSAVVVFTLAVERAMCW